MNTTIWKFPIETEDEQVINVPVGAEFLSVQVQHNQPCIWAKVDPQENVIVREKVVIVGTGHPAKHTNGMMFLGTYQLAGGNFVGHVFVGGV